MDAMELYVWNVERGCQEEATSVSAAIHAAATDTTAKPEGAELA